MLTHRTAAGYPQVDCNQIADTRARDPASIKTSHLTGRARPSGKKRRREEETIASERVLDVSVHRHVFDTDRPFARVLDGIFSGIGQMQSRCGYLTPVRRQMLVGMNAAIADGGARLLADGNQVPVLGLSEWW
jgi:hypothetical protein